MPQTRTVHQQTLPTWLMLHLSSTQLRALQRKQVIVIPTLHIHFQLTTSTLII